MFLDGVQPPEVRVAIVSQTFGLGPHDAHEELGGRPLGPRGRRLLTMRTLDAMRAERLREEFNTSKRGKEAADATVGRWSAGDHEFFKELRALAGFVDSGTGSL